MQVDRGLKQLRSRGGGRVERSQEDAASDRWCGEGSSVRREDR